MKNYKQFIPAFCLALSALTLSACASPRSSAVLYQETDSMAKSKVEFATVTGVRQVKLQGETGYGGMAGGAILGGAAGSQMGGGSGQVVGTVFGALVGAAAGKFTEEALAQKDALEITVKLKDGTHTSIVQAGDLGGFKEGEAVRLVTNNGKVRVAK